MTKTKNILLTTQDIDNFKLTHLILNSIEIYGKQHFYMIIIIIL